MKWNACKHGLHVARIVGPCSARGRPRVKPARRNRVDADAILRPLDRQHPRHLDERAFGDAIGRALGCADQPMGRGDVDDISRPARRYQSTAKLLAEEKGPTQITDRKSTRLNSSHMSISYAVFCLKKKN